MRMIAICLLGFWLLALAACGDRHGADTGKAGGQDSTASLPKPETTGGSVTGMPDRPGPGQIGPPEPDLGSPDRPVASDGTQDAPPLDAATLPGALEPSSPGNPGAIAGESSLAADEPTAQDAVAVVRDYYDAIAAHDYLHAYTLWSDGGGASGKTLQQFANGFADTANVSVQLAAPSRIDAAAGSRYIQVPVTITATQQDGSVRGYAGAYTLRRATVDGATDEQRAWRIVSAQLRDTGP